MGTHRNLVAFQQADGIIVRMDSEIDYDGPATWKFEPLDKAAQAKWLDTHADPERTDNERRRQWSNPSHRPVGSDDKDGWEMR